MSGPYFADEHVVLYHGDFRELLPSVLDDEPDLVVADPPYGETALEWDRWPDSWPSLAPGRSMWCFGSMRMFMTRAAEFCAGGWQLSQDVVWKKHNGSSFAGDRFRRVHEHAAHWYRGAWGDVHHQVPREASEGPRRASATRRRIEHTGQIKPTTWTDDGRRDARSVIYARSMHHEAINETEKPVGLCEPLIAYGCPAGGLVVDLFAGSCSTLVAARATGRRAIGFELRESQCESAARRLSQGDLFAAAIS